MTMRCRADVSRFVQKLSPTAKNKKIKSSEINFSKDEQAVVKEVKILKEKGKTQIFDYELEKILASKMDRNKKQTDATTISKVVSAVNSKYKKMFKKKLLGKKVRNPNGSEPYYEIL